MQKKCSKIVSLIVAIIVVMFIVLICFDSTAGIIGDAGSLIGGISGLFAILVSCCIFRAQQQLSYKIGLNASFYEMLKTLREIYRAYQEQIAECKKSVLKHFANISKDWKPDPKDLQMAYDFYFRRHIQHSSEAMHYLQYFAHVFKMIDGDPELRDVQAKKEYIGLLAAQLSSEEMFLVFFAHMAEGRVVEGLDFSKYSFFEYLETDNWFLDREKKTFFPKTKFVFVRKNESNVKDIDFGDTDYDNEQVWQTIERLKREAREK